MDGGRSLRRLAVLACLLAAAACAPASGGRGSAADRAAPSPGAGRTVTGLSFLSAYENLPSESYYPLEGLAGCQFSAEGTLIVCDEVRGKVYGLEPGAVEWFEFDTPPSRPYRPVDVRVDGFKVLVLDRGGVAVQRFDLTGSWLDEVLDLRAVEPTATVQATSFAVDRDGRWLIVDGGQGLVLMLDAFLNLSLRVGSPGTLSDQFSDPAGVAFLPDGGFVVADHGNRRLALYDRHGFLDRTLGGDYEPDNPFFAPQGVDVDRHGNLFVADAGSGLIHVLGLGRQLLFSAGQEFPLAGTPQVPVDVAVSPDDLLAVTDRARAAILLYRIHYD